MQQADRTPVPLQGVLDKARLVANEQAFTEDGHPLHVARHLDLLELFVAGFALVEFVALHLAFHGHTQARGGAMAHQS